MDREIKKYFGNAIAIIFSCRELLFAYLTICIFEYSYSFFPQNLHIVVLVASISFSFFLMPMAYGRYIEIINGSYLTSYKSLFKTHWINYYSVILILMAILFPFIFILNFILTDHTVHIVRYVGELLIGILSIFIFPLVFLLRERKRPIILGFKCIVGNASDSFYLILLVLFAFIIQLLYENFGLLFGEVNKPIIFFLGFVAGFISMVIDFIVFIVAAMILNTKLLKEDHQ